MPEGMVSRHGTEGAVIAQTARARLAGAVRADCDGIVLTLDEAATLLGALEAAQAEAARWLDKAAREREEADNAWAEVARLRENERALRWGVTQYARALRDRQERNWQAGEESLGATKESFRWVASAYVGAQQLLIETLRDSGIDPEFVSRAALAATASEGA